MITIVVTEFGEFRGAARGSLCTLADVIYPFTESLVCHFQLKVPPTEEYCGSDPRARLGGPWRDDMRYRIEPIDRSTFFPGRFVLGSEARENVTYQFSVNSPTLFNLIEGEPRSYGGVTDFRPRSLPGAT